MRGYAGEGEWAIDRMERAVEEGGVVLVFWAGRRIDHTPTIKTSERTGRRTTRERGAMTETRNALAHDGTIIGICIRTYRVVYQ